jgi:hypothetical protein
MKNIEIRNKKPIKSLNPDMIISSDAAGGQKGGWGAHCEGKSTVEFSRETTTHKSVRIEDSFPGNKNINQT